MQTAKSVFGELQGRYPGRFPDVQLRTLQRRVKEWRERALVEFDDELLRGEVLAGAIAPPRLRVCVEPDPHSAPPNGAFGNIPCCIDCTGLDASARREAGSPRHG